MENSREEQDELTPQKARRIGSTNMHTRAMRAQSVITEKIIEKIVTNIIDMNICRKACWTMNLQKDFNLSLVWNACLI